MTDKEKLASLEAQIRKLEKLASLGTLVAGITHEIQNPLNFVINFSKMSVSLVDDLADMLKDHPDAFSADESEEIDDILKDLSDNLAKISEHGDRAISIVRNTLLYSRGRQDAYIPTDVAHVVKEYVWLAYHSMRANHQGFNVTIHERYAEGLPLVKVVPQDLCRAVLNVTNNALYAVDQKRQRSDGKTDYSPTVDVEVAMEGTDLCITIADNGIGMSEEVKARLFEDFFTTKPEGEGTGLGMGLTRAIIEQKHGGHITFDSTLGEGTTFKLFIPMKS